MAVPRREPVRQAWEDNAHHELNTDEARQGITFGHMRYVLGISVFLLVAIYAIIYFTGAQSW